MFIVCQSRHVKNNFFFTYTADKISSIIFWLTEDLFYVHCKGINIAHLLKDTKDL